MSSNGGSHCTSTASRLLLEFDVAFGDLRRITHKFYGFAFQDVTLDKFIRSYNVPSSDRFAKRIHHKLAGSNIGGEDSRTRDISPDKIAGGRRTVVHDDQTSAHVAAWNSLKHPASEIGHHVSLEECRVWMRLRFWAMRGPGLVELLPSFADYYVRFNGIL